MLSYIIKSIITLSVLYLPYMLLLRRESFFRFNRLMLLTIMVLSLVLPLLDVHEWAWTYNPISDHLRNGFVEVGSPIMMGVEGDATVATPTTHSWFSVNGWALATYLYVMGMLATLLVKSVQITLLYHQIHRGVLWTDKKDGITLYCHTGNVASFSWMHAIVISEEDYNSNASAILRHEMGHILHHHSFDMLLLNLCQVVQWANPLVWVLAHSLRDVHEYEADDHVLRSGINAIQYQNLLIKKAVGSSSYAFANGFNHSLLKKRITMMLQKKSNPWMRTKALYLIPVAAVALSAFATPVFNNTASAHTAKSVNTGKVTTISANAQTSVAENAPTALPDGDKVYDKCEILPAYPGGAAALMQFVYENLRYPEVAMKNGVYGRVLVQFVVEKDGKCSSFEIAKKPSQHLKPIKNHVAPTEDVANRDFITTEEFETAQKACEDEVLRVCQLMSDWTPGKEQGQEVRVRFTLPVAFRLQ